MTPASFVVKCASRGIRLYQCRTDAQKILLYGPAVTPAIQEYLNQNMEQIRAIVAPPSPGKTVLLPVNAVNVVNASEPAPEEEAEPFAALSLPLCASAAAIMDGMQWSRLRALLTENMVWHGVYDVAAQMRLLPDKVRAALEFLHLYRFTDGDDRYRPVLERCEIGGQRANVIGPGKKWISVPAVYYFAVPGQLDLSLLEQEPPPPPVAEEDASAEKPNKVPDGDTGQERLF